MFGFKKDKKSPSQSESTDKASFFRRLKQGLGKTRANITQGMGRLFSGAIDQDTLEELETHLLTADVGMEATMEIIDDLGNRLNKKQLENMDMLMAAMRESMLHILQPCNKPLTITEQRPFVILMVGINGAGKTTTIGKLAKHLQTQGLKVMLAAGDTFRAAAVEQLKEWGQRNDVAVVSQHDGADPAAVIFDAMQSAKAKNVDVLLADTAGRLHTQDNLMEELKKVKRVMQKGDAEAPHEIFLVIDSGTGQNALNQAKQFNDLLGLTGIILTKMDGTAKGGVIFAIAKKLALPVPFIGIGEGIDDLQDFNAENFVDALLSSDEQKGS